MFRVFSPARPGLAAAVIVLALAAVIIAPPAFHTRSSHAQASDEIQFAFSGLPTAITLRLPGGTPPYTIAIESPPQHGALADGSDTAVLYTSTAGYSGPDSLRYTITDAAGASRTAAVAITVLPLDEPAGAPTPPAAEAAATVPGPQRIPGEYIVHYTPGTSPEAVESLVAEYGGRVLQRLDAIHAVVISLPGGEAATTMQAESGLDLEPNLLRQPMLTPNDPSLGNQWAFNNMHAYAAWDVTTGSPDVVLGILDTGVDLNHPDLNDHLLAGYDFVDGDTVPQDTAGHGTHVAGIANAESNNGLGVAGVAWDARMLPVRIIGPFGATSANIANGLIYAADNGVKIVNMSLGGAGWVQVERDAVNYAAARGVVIFASAGNDGATTNFVNYPASYDHVISVANTTNLNQRASSSSYNEFVDIAAPGSVIYSTYYDDTYTYLSGTSMASPNAAGVAALVWSAGLADTAGEVTRAVLCSTLDLGATGRDDFYGYGLAQADLAVAYNPGSTATCLPSVPHDDFDAARPIGSASYTDTVSTRDATSWEDDPAMCAGTGSRTVWYRYNAVSDGTLTLDTVGSTYDTVMAAYTGSRGNLAELGCNNDTAGSASRLEFSVQAGTTYYVMVSSLGHAGHGGTLTLHAAFNLYPPAGCYPVEPGSSTVVCVSN